MTPAEFISKWQANTLSERAGAQSHFLDLCELLGVDKPSDPDTYCFERGAHRTGAGHGWADVWKRDHFAWEYKAPGADLGKALKQLMTYALALDNPPLLVVSDRLVIHIHTHFTGTPSEVHTIRIDDIGTPDNLAKLHWLFASPDRFRPARDNRQITEDAARTFAELAQSLRRRHTAPEDNQRIAHFLTQCLFCLFAEDAELLPRGLFLRVLDKSHHDPDRLASRLRELFSTMQKGGDFGVDEVPWFNGGLFEIIDPLPLTEAEAHNLLAAARLDWNAIDPAIFGTLFERGLDPKKRSQLGAHYTDPATIMRLVEPTIVRPLTAEWDAAKAKIAAALGKSKKAGDKAYKDAQAAFIGHLERLRNFRVLDPACGSGNFLYLALKALKELEHRANLDAEALGLHRQVGIETGPANVLGIELNEYAAELARVTVWIGELQWMRAHGYPVRRNPILDRLEHVENRDALIEILHGTDWDDVDDAGNDIHGPMFHAIEQEWPTCDAIVGNPPFLGDKMMRGELGNDYTEALRQCYKGRVPGGADLVTYWFEKARAHIEAGKCTTAGLVATQAIRKGANRAVLDRILAGTRIFEAWRDEPWTNEGAAVRVSLVNFGHADGARLDGTTVVGIQADLSSATGFNLTTAQPLSENLACAFQGPVKVGAFDIPGVLAREWLKQPNPNVRPNSDVVRPWANGQDLAGRSSDTWIIDFGATMKESDAAMFEAPFKHVLEQVKPMREAGRRESRKKFWWRHGETVPAMRRAMAGLSRYLATPRVAKHRFFVWQPVAVLPDSRLYAICSGYDASFGILSSRLHEAWALANASRHGDGDEGGRPTYNASVCFEAFPFPAGLTPRDTANGAPTGPLADAIASAAQRLDELRQNWLNPPEWVDWVITPEEEVAGFPKRPVAKPDHEAELKKRTLTNLYNQRPAWLDHAHKTLDAAVAAAYGWTDYTPDMADDELLRRLLALNLERSAR